MSVTVDTEHSCAPMLGQLRMTLSRRDFLKRLGLAGTGAAALTLIGCGEDGSAPQPQPVLEQQPVQQVQQIQQQEVAQPALQPAQEEQPEVVQEQGAVQRAQVVEEARRRRQAQQTRHAAPVVQHEREAQQSEPAQPEPPAERRLLVSDVPAGDYELQDPAFDPIAGARVDFGDIEGAGYRIELPEQWNGELVLWAHGFRGLNDEGTGFSRRLTFDDIPARDAIIGQGYGWATSTYRANGYVPGIGVDDLLRVKDQVAQIARPPRRTYIAGGSMGGATAQLMAQEFPEEIAAALAFCPAMGNVWVVDYTVAWHALAHWLIGYPPDQMDPEGMLRWAEPLGRANENGLMLTDAGIQFAALIKDFTGGDRWGFDEGLWQQWNIAFGLGVTLWPGIVGADSLSPGALIAVSDDQPPADSRSHIYSAAPDAGIVGADSLSPGALIAVSDDQPPADSRSHIYSAAPDAGIVGADSLSPGALIAVSDDQPPADSRSHIYSAAPDAGIDLERLNDEVIRVTSTPERRNDPGVGLPTGELRRPMLATKTTGDLFTPIHLDRDYQRLIGKSGWERNLVIQSVRRAGHCAFSEREALSAFTAVIAWLSFGFAPGGDDLQGDLSEVGTRFTDPFDDDDPLRPTT